MQPRRLSSRRTRSASHQSETFVRKQRYKTAGIVLVAIVAFASWSFNIVRMTQVDAFTIHTIEVQGAEPDIAASIRAAAEQALEGNFAGVFPKASIFVYPEDAIRSAVEKSSPRISEATVKRAGSHRLVVSVIEKQPSALVCASLPNFDGNILSLEDSDACYFADETGVLFARAPSFSGTVYNRYYIPELASHDSKLGIQALPPEQFASVQSFVSGAQNVGIHIEAMLIQDDGDYEIYTEKTVIYATAARPLSEQLVNLVSFWNKKTADARAKKQSLNFDSIDVRYGPNVFYRETQD